MKSISIIILFSLLLQSFSCWGQKVAYIYGNVAPDGSMPADDKPFHQMLLTDTGKLGASTFKKIVEAEGYRIDQFYDQETQLDDAFLAPFDAVVFGLHQKKWSANEKKALDQWLKKGGGMLIYSDSASGGSHKKVGLRNSVGQDVVNRLISDYGMNVTTDQGGGTRSYRPSEKNTHPVVQGLILEGEGVSPVAVDPKSDAQVLVPLDKQHLVEESHKLKVRDDGVKVKNPQWAALAMAKVGAGSVFVLFDRQPIWNDGPGSNITQKDNQEILRRIVRFMVEGK